MGGKIYLYTDNDGTHSVKVGGIAYKHRTRRYDGTHFSNDGEVSFYDSSITQDEIDALNNDPDYPDPFEGKYGVEIPRSEYNQAIRDGRLKYQVFDNFYPINESEFDWAIETPEGFDVHERKKAIEFEPVLRKVFDGTRFEVTIENGLIGIVDATGIYLDWGVDEVMTINNIINEFRQEVNRSYDEELREEYRDVYVLLLRYFKNN
jgi:hypothetical protein